MDNESANSPLAMHPQHLVDPLPPKACRPTMARLPWCPLPRLTVLMTAAGRKIMCAALNNTSRLAPRPTRRSFNTSTSAAVSTAAVGRLAQRRAAPSSRSCGTRARQDVQRIGCRGRSSGPRGANDDGGREPLRCASWRRHQFLKAHEVRDEYIIAREGVWRKRALCLLAWVALAGRGALFGRLGSPHALH